MAFVVVVLFYFIFFYIFFKRETCTSFKTTCGDMANDEAIDFKVSSRCTCRMLQERRTLGITKRNLIYYDGPLEKLWGGIFKPREFFFLIKFLHEFQF